MKNAFWGYWLVLLGIAIVVIMLLVQNLTSTSTQDYFLVKEITEAAMVDAVDYTYYRNYGEIRINKEKFYESFFRRFAETASLTTNYTVSFFGVYEAPPKVSVEIKSKSASFNVVGDSTQFDMVERIDSILEGNPLDESTVDDGFGGIIDNPSIGNDKNSSSGSGSSGGSTSDGGSGSSGGSASDGGSGSSGGSTSDGGSGSSGGSTSDGGSGSSGGSTSGNEGSGNEELACSEGVTNKSLSGMHGKAMSTVANSVAIYDSVNMKNKIGTVDINKTFTIIGSNDNDTLWAIEYEGECGWVKNDYMAINLKDYIPEMSYNITNASSSIYMSSGQRLEGVTGTRLYSSEYQSFVPATYSFAKKLKVAAANAKAGGDTLVVYDAYRPTSVSSKAKKALEKLYNSNSTVKKNINTSYGASGTAYSWGKGWFLASSLSAHNTGCAVDITLASGSMPSAMHELSVAAIKYYHAIKVRNQPMSYHESNYAKTMTDAAKKLDRYMTSAGLDDLASEWWHFQDDSCHSKIGSGLNFWAA